MSTTSLTWIVRRLLVCLAAGALCACGGGGSNPYKTPATSTELLKAGTSLALDDQPATSGTEQSVIDNFN